MTLVNLDSFTKKIGMTYIDRLTVVYFFSDLSQESFLIDAIMLPKQFPFRYYSIYQTQQRVGDDILQNVSFYICLKKLRVMTIQKFVVVIQKILFPQITVQ